VAKQRPSFSLTPVKRLRLTALRDSRNVNVIIIMPGVAAHVPGF